MKPFSLVAAALLALAGGCVSNADVVAKVRPRAAFDLGCPEQQVEVMLLEGDPGKHASYGASGCGKRARYETSCVGTDGPQTCQVRTQSLEGGDSAAPAPSPTPAPAPVPPPAPAHAP